jgi:S-adenosylmethionine:tRNA ribosyltransferase-isomerase
MRTADFDYHLPAELIAQHPAARREDSRLLVVDRAARTIEHRSFRDLPGYLRRGDCLFRNVARVLPARLFAQRPTGGQVECLLLRPASAGGSRWWCLLRPGRRLRVGAVFGRNGEFSARVTAKSESAEYLVDFTPFRPGESVPALAERLGRIPLPPYIQREASGVPPARPGSTAAGSGPDSGEDALDDTTRYQTVFADRRHTVAVAAPTAGLHFSSELLESLRAAGIEFADLVLHVGLGTFRPIETERVADHPIHRETIEIGPAVETAVAAKRTGRRIAVGTTSVRTLEFFSRQPPDVRAAAATPAGLMAEADLFIHPPFTFQVVEALITNFHLPRSTLLCLVAAFLAPGSTDGVSWLKEIYAEAVRERYRFLSYGDAMLIL